MTAPLAPQLGRNMQRGFVLAATLWMLAIMAVAATYFAERIQRSRELAQLAQAHSQVLLDLGNARAEILFRIATTPFSVYGLGPSANEAITLDDRPYLAPGGTLIRLQDNRGLLNLNVVSDDRLERFLGILGAPAARRAALIDTLRDYIDEDNLKHLNGAETADYAAAGLPPPRNAKLITPMEARSIYGWADVPQLWQDNLLLRLTTTSSSLSVNPNTAPWQVLATMRDMTPQAAQAIIQARKLAPIVHAGQIEALTGIQIYTDPFMPDAITFPADSVRITQQPKGMGWGWQYNVTLAPVSDTAPWRIDYSYRVELSSFDAAKQALQPLPARAAFQPESLVPFL
jgi:type II secretory pathway component PulK